MTIFDFDDYKAYVRQRIRENTVVRGYQGQLAKSSGTQPSYFSSMLSSPKTHLTPDAAVLLAQFWKLDADETDFFLELVHLGRASSEPLRRLHLRRIARIRKRRADLHLRFQRPDRAPEADATTYYSAWYWAAIHLSVGVPELQTPQAIARRLGLPEGLVLQCLRGLEAMGMVESKGQRWVNRKANLHLPQSSPLTRVNHLNWRMKALEGVPRSSEHELHYTAVHSLGKEAFARIRELLLETVDRTREIVGPSPDEELACVTFDFFRL